MAIDRVVRCNFCNRPSAEIGGVISSPTGINVCEECCHVSSLIFFRRNELMAEAKRLSDEAKASNQKRDGDGNCNCMPCTLARLVDTDSEMNSLARIGASYVDDGTTNQTKH